LYATSTVANLRADADIKADSQLTETELLAQRTAHTGLALALSQVRRDFEGWRQYLNPGTPVAATGGTFRATASGTVAGPVVVAASGTVDTTAFDVYRLLARLAEVPAAVTITSDSTVATLSGGGWVVSGRDTPSFSQLVREEGYGLAGTRVPGVWTSTEQTAGAVTDALTLLTRDQMRGVTDRSDVTRAGTEAVLRALAAEAKGAVTDAYTGDQTFSGQAFGSLGNPVVVRVAGDATFTGQTVGYGVLLVEGDLVASGDFEWHGLVVAEGVGALDVTLAGEAKVYGALYIDHDSGGTTTTTGDAPIVIGGGEYGTHTLWASVDQEGALYYYTPDDTGALVRQREGALVGIQEPRVGDDDVTDIEAMTFADDGTLYFVNNANYGGASDHPDNLALYRVAASEFDGNSATPLRAERIGPTRQASEQDEVRGLFFHNGTLYGTSAWNHWIYRMDLNTGEATRYRQFDGPGWQWYSLMRAPDGHVYTLRRINGGDYLSDTHEIWRFESFPDGNPTRVSEIAGIQRSDALTAHPDGYFYMLTGSDSGGDRLLRIDPADGSYTALPAPEADTQAFTYHYAGEEAAMDTGTTVAPFASVPRRSNVETFQHTARWPGNPDVAVDVTVEQIAGGPRNVIVEGTTLEGAAQAASLGFNNDTGHTDINNPDYTGPRDLQLLRVTPGNMSAATRIEVRMTLSEAFTQPFYLHVLDLDFAPLAFEAYDASGNRISTAGWTLSKSLDLLLSNGQADAVNYRWDGQQGQLEPTVYKETEMIGGQLTVPNFADVREIRVLYEARRNEIFMLGLSSVPLYGASATTTNGEPLQYTQRDNAAVYYSTEALGQLVPLLPTARQSAWVVEYDAFGMDVRALLDDAQTPAPNAEAPLPRREDASRVLVCIDGRERKVSLVGLELYLAQGATEGACAASGGSVGQGVPVDPRAMVSICHEGRTKQVRAGDLAFWLGRGAREGACGVAPSAPVPDRGGDRDDDDDDDDRDDDSDDDDRDDD
ncbi:MAG: hypothetical protein AAGG50_18160, partial [Bacteroidota bacterium]